jgi:hypothetical protein
MNRFLKAAANSSKNTGKLSTSVGFRNAFIRPLVAFGNPFMTALAESRKSTEISKLFIQEVSKLIFNYLRMLKHLKILSVLQKVLI